MLVKFKKYIATALIVMVAFVSAAGGLLAPEPAHAQLATLTFGSIPDQLKQIGDVIFNALITALKVATVRTMAFAVRKVAYDSAVWLASGAKGQNQFAQTEKFGSYVAEVGDQALGTFVEQLGTDKLNLCHLPDIKLDMAMKIGLRTNFANGAPTKPDCSLSQLANNWGQEWDSKYGAQSTVKRFNDIIQADNSSDLGIQLQTTEKIANVVEQQTIAATLERQEGKGYKSKDSPISGQIQTPPSLIEEQFKAITPDKGVKEDIDTIKSMFNSDQPSVLASGLSIFLNTLVSTAITNFRDRGVLPTDLETAGPQAANEPNAVPTGGTQVAAEFYRELQTVKIDEVSNYDVLSQLGSCSDAPGTYNCRANDDLVTAVKKAETGKPVTIGQALASSGLRGEFLLIPPTSAKNKEIDCYSSAYCYSNIQILRQLRILPLGFEIAALNSDPDHPWTLKKVVDGFNDCQYVDQSDHSKGIINDSSGHPFCHLIDPDWVLKAPLTKCRAKAPGAALLSAGVPNRLEDCEDLQTCVHYAANGSCDNFGYCAREENKWNFSADQCDAYATTCRTFTNRTTGVPASYLYRTLDTGFCSEKNIGCTAYSLSQQDGKWQGPATPGASLNFSNTGIYFNKSVSNACSGGSQGCSAFLVNGSTANDLLYLKKAPDYLKCYDANPGTIEVDWPQSVADLSRITGDNACKNYAAVCTKEEVSCSLYTPTAGGDQVPGQYTPHEIVNGQIKWNDECSATCVGYAAYREMPSRYSNGQAVSYIIPSSGDTCAPVDEGCTAFTNLGTTEGGVEKVEYFSKLRPCVTPEKDKGKTYITYEGSRESGFQLKTYILVENKDSDADSSNNGPTGAPKYFYKDATELQNNLDECNEERYKSGKASVDCRQFNDEQGRVYYRLLPFTVPVTSACTAYRLSNPELDTNGQCFQNGEYRDGSCFYNGLPEGVNNTAGESQACTAAVNTCRAYKGTGGGVAGQVFEDTFDPASASSTLALKDWSGNIIWSNESTHAGEHSLEVSGSAVKTVALDAGASFDVTFWAKGIGGSVTVQLKRTDASPNTLGVISAGDTWNYYHLGPLEVDGVATSSAAIIFTVSGGGRVWLDNIALNHSVGLIYLVKKSLSVDKACDSHLDDNLPGEALGCLAYTNSTNNKQPVYLTNFTKLCRAEAIGCTSVLDTNNTLTVDRNGTYQTGDEGARAYNVWLTATGGTTVSTTIGTDSYSCAVPVGETGCYLDKPILNHSASEIQAVSGVNFVKSTIYIPGDTPAASPVYLVANKPATCNRIDLGCTYAGIAKTTPTGVAYVTTTVKNDPNGAAGYEKTLCQDQAVGCEAFTDSANSPYYFKDPVALGKKICTYRTDVSVNGNKASGWFWKGVGVCTALNQANNGVICQENTDCASGYTCQGRDSQPCYPDYFENGGTYGLWSYGNVQKYQNFVGECKNTQDRCTEFVDHINTNTADPSKSVDQAYYLINDPIKLNQGNCAGDVSQKTGCALLDQTENPNKYWSRTLSYQASEHVFKAVPPVKSSDASGLNDSNIILKATPDRGCGEWLQCSHSFPATDNTGKTKQVCQSLERCNQWVTSEDCGLWVKSDYSNQLLTDNIYRDRDVSWSGRDYDGFSIIGMYPPEELAQLNFSSSTSNPDWRLVKRIPCGSGSNSNCAANVQPTDYSCAVNNVTCGGSNPGICVNGTCVKEIRGGDDQASLASSPTQTCRAYPEKTSPFPNTKNIRGKPDFAQVNVCDESFLQFKKAPESKACECDYTKVAYGDILTRYFNYRQPNSIAPIVGGNINFAPEGICQGGDHGGLVCTSDDDCYRLSDPSTPSSAPAADTAGNKILDGVCEKKKAERKFVGWRGFCLEPDKTRTINAENNEYSCLTWLPIDALEGAPDIYNQHTEAGFVNPSSGGKLYCLNASGVDLVEDTRPDYPISSDSRDRYRYSSLEGDLDSGVFDQAHRGYLDAADDFVNGSYTSVWGSSRTGGGLRENVIKQSDIEKIRVWSLLKFSTAGAVFDIVPNDFLGLSRHLYQSYFVVNDNDNKPRQVAIGNYLGRPNEFVMLVASGLQDGTNTSHIDPATGDFVFKIGSQTGLNGNIFTTSGLRVGTSMLPISSFGDQGLWGSSAAITFDMCPTNVSGVSSNIAWWYALRLVFDPTTHRFVRYYHAACDVFFIEGSGISWQIADELKVTFKLKNWCSDIGDATIDTTNDDFAQLRAVAWTDRVWKQQFSLTYLGYNYQTRIVPFGSLAINQIPYDNLQVVRSPMQTIPCPPGVVAGADNCKLLNFTTTEPKNVEYAPYSCYSPSDCKITLGSPNPPGSNIDTATSYLSGVFASLKNIWQYNAGIGPYTASAPTQIKNITAIGDYSHSPVPPQIRAVGGCVSERQCIEVATTTAVGFTINDRYNRDIVVRGHSLKAAAKFFAFADKEQMPIRQITVDWDDGSSPASPPLGYFRNQRGLTPPWCKPTASGVGRGVCANRITGAVPEQDSQQRCIRDSDCPAQPICQVLISDPATNAPITDFDKVADKTCVTDYFEFTNEHYDCSSASPRFKVPGSPECRNNQNVDFPNGCCVFRPRVQVKDNWGWCNGSCAGTATVQHPNGGCYDNKWNVANSGVDECSNSSNVPWTTFGGKIILAPKL